MSMVKTSSIVTTGGTQSRVALSEHAVSEYAEAMLAGAELPPIVIFHDGSAFWLADGFHRVMAANRAGLESLPADVRKGTKRDAILYSVGANSAHGLPRSNADKRRAVEMLLADEEWMSWSDHEIARRCTVSAPFVGDVRRGYRTRSTGKNTLETDSSIPQTRSFTHPKTGATTTMKTENIGRVNKDSATRAAEISHLAGSGNRSSQIGEKLGISEERVRLIARQNNIELPDKVIGKAHKINNRRVIEQTVLGLEASSQSLQTITFSFEGITREEAQEWEQSLSESLAIYRQFHKRLKEVANG